MEMTNKFLKELLAPNSFIKAGFKELGIEDPKVDGIQVDKYTIGLYNWCPKEKAIKIKKILGNINPKLSFKERMAVGAVFGKINWLVSEIQTMIESLDQQEMDKFLIRNNTTPYDKELLDAIGVVRAQGRRAPARHLKRIRANSSPEEREVKVKVKGKSKVKNKIKNKTCFLDK